MTIEGNFLMDTLRDSQLVFFSPSTIFITFSFKSLTGFLFKLLQSRRRWKLEVASDFYVWPLWALTGVSKQAGKCRSSSTVQLDYNAITLIQTISQKMCTEAWRILMNNNWRIFLINTSWSKLYDSSYFIFLTITCSIPWNDAQRQINLIYTLSRVSSNTPSGLMLQVGKQQLHDEFSYSCDL